MSFLIQQELSVTGSDTRCYTLVSTSTYGTIMCDGTTILLVYVYS